MTAAPPATVVSNAGNAPANEPSVSMSFKSPIATNGVLTEHHSALTMEATSGHAVDVTHSATKPSDTSALHHTTAATEAAAAVHIDPAAAAAPVAGLDCRRRPGATELPGLGGWATGRTRRSRGKSRGNAHVTDETAIRPQRRHGQGRNGDSPAAWRHRFDNAWCISDADPPGAVGVPTIASSQPARRPVGRRLSQFVASGVGGTVILL